MNRLAILLIVALIVAWARPAAAAAGFDTATAASVWAAALSYIAPRSLTPVGIPQMTIWGLNGLAALDPDLNTKLQEGQIRLYGPNQMLMAITAPAPADAAAWGQAAAKIANSAYAASPALQQAGTQGLIDSFFDELFNHFDPYSRYEAPLQAAQDELMVTGVAGTGITLGRQGSQVIIAGTAADSPAAEAGITQGMTVLAIDNRPVFASQLQNLNDNLNGIQGTQVQLKVRDTGDPAAVSVITLTRAFVPPQTVFPEMLDGLAQTVLALKITSFNKGTSDQFSASLVAGLAASPPPAGLVLDLRGNRGGVLHQAVLVADSLLPTGKIAEAAGRDPDSERDFLAEGSDLTGGLPIVVLVDGQTASAAEILAAALADDGRAVVVGSTTLGKGLVQTVTSLPDGGELFVTWSRVLAPRGWPLQTLGLMPQVCTSLGQQALGNQFLSLKSGKNLMQPAVAASRAARAPLPINTILTIRNQCPADTGSNLDVTAAQFLLASGNAYQAALLPRA